MKALRQAKKRTTRNNAVEKELKIALKHARRATETMSAEAQAMLKKTVQLVDKAVRKNVLKKNAASRTKSRLMKLWNKRKGK